MVASVCVTKMISRHPNMSRCLESATVVPVKVLSWFVMCPNPVLSNQWFPRISRRPSRSFPKEWVPWRNGVPLSAPCPRWRKKPRHIMRSALLASSKSTAMGWFIKEPPRVPAALTCATISSSVGQSMPRMVCEFRHQRDAPLSPVIPPWDPSARMKLRWTFACSQCQDVFTANMNGLGCPCVPWFILLCEERGVKKQCHPIGSGVTSAWIECCSRLTRSRRKKQQAGFRWGQGGWPFPIGVVNQFILLNVYNNIYIWQGY